jgi:hypothetical protein
MYELIILFLTVFLFIPMLVGSMFWFLEMPEAEGMILVWFHTFVFSLMAMWHWMFWLLLLFCVWGLHKVSTNGEFRRPQAIATALGMIWIVLSCFANKQEIIENRQPPPLESTTWTPYN